MLDFAPGAGGFPLCAYKNRMKPYLPCQIVYVKHETASGWRWQPVGGTASREVHPLFYECVVAARAHGYEPGNLKCR